jgi:hypothetical protein
MIRPQHLVEYLVCLSSILVYISVTGAAALFKKFPSSGYHHHHMMIIVPVLVHSAYGAIRTDKKQKKWYRIQNRKNGTESKAHRFCRGKFCLPTKRKFRLFEPKIRNWCKDPNCESLYRG